MTIGWIREDDLDAFYEGTERTPDPRRATEPALNCPFCISVFTKQTELQNHVYSVHRVERPLIIVCGIEPSAKHIFRAHLSHTDIIVANTNFANVHVNGAKPSHMTDLELGDLMTQASQAEIRLELVNSEQPNGAPVTSIYNLSFRIADEETLTAVEEAFREILGSKVITRGTIGEFLSDLRTTGSGKEYASGLANYCLGILLKERPEGEDLTTQFSRYRECYGTALDILKDIQRPLAILIMSIIRFVMNDFDDERLRTGYLKLDFAVDLLRDPNADAFPKIHRDPNRCLVCPVDHGTLRVLELASKLANQQRWSPILEGECREVAQSGLLDESDHQKAYAIWAASAWRLGALTRISEPLIQIAEIYPFSNWAREYLEKVST